jgi:hypothetical protein
MPAAQFLNAVPLGQITTGPVVQTVVVLGYTAAGLAGEILASAVAFHAVVQLRAARGAPLRPPARRPPGPPSPAGKRVSRQPPAVRAPDSLAFPVRRRAPRHGGPTAVRLGHRRPSDGGAVLDHDMESGRKVTVRNSAGIPKNTPDPAGN